MRVFEILIDDDRYKVPTLVFLTMTDEHRVRAFALEKLGDSRHHLGIEVREGGVRLFGLGTMSDTEDPSGAASQAP